MNNIRRNVFLIFSVIGLTAFTFLTLTLKAQDKPDTKHEVYAQEIPGSTEAIEMVPVPGGAFLMGSPETEADRDVDEGPQRIIKVDGFWMGKFEITWDQYELFMQKENIIKDSIRSQVALEREMEAEGITRPSPPYEDPSFGMGKYGYPASSMTQFAALMYCKWLSTKTGHFYRLPTEAEWEYACRAGATTAFPFGDDVTELDDFGWHYENAQYAYHKVGELKSNAFGLYDIIGNVAEWTIDHYYPDYYEKLEGDTVENPWMQPMALYPRTVKGGSYYDDPDKLRCASRIPTDPEKWKQRDPQIPKSFWWNTDSPFVGFRVVRPFDEPTKEEQDAFWARNLDE